MAWRKQQLRQLARMFQENIDAIQQAAFLDAGKPPLECVMIEVIAVVKACACALANLEVWTAVEKPQVEPMRSAWDASVYPVPKGVVLLISPWNNPWVIAFGPFVGAVAAGCAAVLKPSELSQASAALMASLVSRYLDPSAYAVVNGGVDETQALLDLRWDHILFTGSGNVGRIVATAAAKHVTPVSLELGGKCPVIVDASCDAFLAAKRIMFGKIQNSGQVCVAPDYVLVDRRIYVAFLDSLREVFALFWPKGALHPDAEWGKMINGKHFQRVKNLVTASKGTVLLGGEVEEEGLRIAPTIVVDVRPEDPLMVEEIFGPILPVMAVDSVDDAIDYLSPRPTPLVVYAFTDDPSAHAKLLAQTESGTLSLNDTMSFLSAYELPFGGQRESGYGAHHSKYSFEMFTHRRASVNVPLQAEQAMSKRYPPYSMEAYEAFRAIALSPIPDN